MVEHQGAVDDAYSVKRLDLFADVAPGVCAEFNGGRLPRRLRVAGHSARANVATLVQHRVRDLAGGVAMKTDGSGNRAQFEGGVRRRVDPVPSLSGQLREERVAGTREGQDEVRVGIL